MKKLQNNKLIIEYDSSKNGIKRILSKADQYSLNWVKSGSGLFGELYGEYNKTEFKYEPNHITATYYYNELEVVCDISLDDNNAYIDYVFTNKQPNPLTFDTGDIGIFAPFNDTYSPYTKEYQLTKKCHAHIWCGESSSYIYALRMSGEENNFAVQLVGGQIADYAIVRKLNVSDRGDFVLLFRPFTINPMDKLHIRLKLFTFRNEERFFEKLQKEESYLKIDMDKFTYRVKEKIKVNLNGKNINSINVMCDGKPVEVVKQEDESYLVCGSFETVGIKKFTIKYNNHTTHFEINVIENELELIDKRLKFIVENQQNTDCTDSRYGAYYLYNYIEERKFYESGKKSNKGLGRARVGMGIAILARLISNFPIDSDLKSQLDESIRMYVDFVDRAIVSDNGMVADAPFKKIGNNFSNYGNYCLLYCLMFQYTEDRRYYDKAISIIDKFYEKGGSNAYVLEVPILKLIQASYQLGENGIAEDLRAKYLVHIENILKKGIQFPTATTRFSDTVVASAADVMLDAYEITKEEKYLIEAKKMFKILLSFSGKQPSVFMHDSAIRHWEGYIFGESKQFGDNFPSCGSCLTAKVLSRYSKAKNHPVYQKRANNLLFNTLLLYNDNRASCCYIYPYKINNTYGKKFDMATNNQDWIIYYNLMYNEEFNKPFLTLENASDMQNAPTEEKIN